MKFISLVSVASLLLVSGCSPHVRTSTHETTSGKLVEVIQIRNGAGLLHPHQGMILVEQKNPDGSVERFDSSGQSGSAIEQLWGPGASVASSAARRPDRTSVLYQADNHLTGGNANASAKADADAEANANSRSESEVDLGKNRHHGKW